MTRIAVVGELDPSFPPHQATVAACAHSAALLDAEGDVRVVELPEHPFFIATLFVPQLRSTAERPHPLITAFVAAAVEALTETTHRRIL